MKNKLILMVLLTAFLIFSTASAAPTYLASFDQGPTDIPNIAGENGFVREGNIPTFNLKPNFFGDTERDNTKLTLTITSTNAPNDTQDGITNGSGTDLFTAYPSLSVINNEDGTWTISGMEIIWDTGYGDCFDANHFKAVACSPAELIFNYATLGAPGESGSLNFVFKAEDTGGGDVGTSAEFSAVVAASSAGATIISNSHDIFYDSKGDGSIDSNLGTGKKTLSTGNAYYIKPTGAGNHWMKIVPKDGDGFWTESYFDSATFATTSDKIYENFYTALPLFAADVDTDDFDFYLLIDATEFDSAYFCNYAEADTEEEISTNCGGWGSADTEDTPITLTSEEAGAPVGNFYISPNPMIGSGGGGITVTGVPEFSDLGWIFAAVLGAGGFIMFRRRVK